MFRLLCQLARPFDLEGANPHPLPSPLAAAAWQALVAAALEHGTAGLLCAKLLALDPAALPPGMPEACDAYLAASRRDLAANLAQLRRLLDRLAAAGLDGVAFKGPAFALAAYPDPALRRSRDLDLLIRPQHRDPALAALAADGYATALHDLPAPRRAAYYRYNGQDILFADDGRLPVEPHWALAPRAFPIALAVDAVMDRALRHKLPVPAPEDALLIAALHGCKEEWTRLIWVADVAAHFAAHPALDADTLLARATESRCRRMLLTATLLATDLLGAEPPPALLDAARADPSAVNLAARAARRLARSTPETSVYRLTRFRWQVQDRPADRLRYLGRVLLTPRVPHFRTVPLPEPLAFLYPAIRLGLELLVWPAWRVWRRLIPRSAAPARSPAHPVGPAPG